MNLNKTILCLVSILCFNSSQASVADYLKQIKTDPNRLYALFKKMPKGGELHYHLSGGAYPEAMLSLAATGDYCLDKNTFVMNKNTTGCNGEKSDNIMSQPALYTQIIKSWSMKDFVHGNESGHDHFFNSFIKYNSIVFDFRPQLLVDIIQRAAQQHELYLEIMTLPDNAHSTTFGEFIKNVNSYDEKKKTLLNNKEFQANITKTTAESDAILEQLHHELKCKTNPKSHQCAIKVKFLYYVLREQPIDNMFAQALNAFEAVSRSKGNLVGVNLVQAEDGIIALRDYRKHMKIFEFLHKNYPKVPISLHAGELEPEAVLPQDLNFHIHDALFTGNAQRIGHGVDIHYENNPEKTLTYMSTHHIPVEINLISNQKILNISGSKHPLNDYLAHNVPVVFSTDDEGILRTDLTRQYVEAVLAHGLDYPTIKHINRNAITYSFLPGKSIWANASKEELIPECRNLNSPSCREVIMNNEKGTMQWNLEQQLLHFENEF